MAFSAEVVFALDFDLLFNSCSTLLCIDIDWPSEFGLFTAAYWIAKMKINPIFYYFLQPEEKSNSVNLLLSLASKALRRKIVFVSIFENMESLSFKFEPADDSNSKTVYYITGFRKYFFLSILKKCL